jgi:TRAP-type mannitol/chloroaromatic compound transport system permease small subunit
MDKLFDEFTRIINSLSEKVGKSIKWLSCGLVGIGVYEVVARFVFNSPTEWGYELLQMLGATMYVLSWAYLHYTDGHVKIGIVYNALPESARKIIDILCAIFLHLPLMGALSYFSFNKMWRSWEIGEKSIATTWYPPLGPLKTIVFIGILLFTLQTISRLITDIKTLIKYQRKKKTQEAT